MNDKAIAQVYDDGSKQWMDAFTSPEPWTRDALCAETDPESFFPELGSSARTAKAVCARCDVTAACLAYALRTKQRWGVWGGRSERERNAMRKGGRA